MRGLRNTVYLVNMTITSLLYNHQHNTKSKYKLIR